MAKVVLTVDDSASIRQMVSFTLKSAGYEVVEAVDGEDGLNKAKGKQANLVLTDQNMPKMDGLTLIKALRGLPQYRATPILMLTTESSDAMKAAGCEDLEYCQLEPGPAIGLGTVGEDQIPVVTVGRTPLSAFVGFEVAVRPIIAALAGRESLFRPVVRANLTDALASKSDRRQFIAAIVRLDSAAPRAIVTVLDEPADEAALWLFRANALVIAPESATSLAAQEEVAVIRLDRE